jgi:predicted alpha/beta-fold hydrolase
MDFTEHFFFFINNENGYKLFGAHYVPAQPIGIQYVFLKPIGTERNVIDAVQVNLARKLAASGIHVLCFDYFGTGDSEGSFNQISLNTLTSDIQAAISNLLTNCGGNKVCLFGLRFGGFLAGYFTEMNLNLIDNLILCAPILEPFDFIKQELRQSISTQLILFQKIIMKRDEIIHNILDESNTIVKGFNLANLNGFVFSKQFLETFKNVSFSKEKRFKNNCLILDINKKMPKKNKYQKFVEQYRHSYSIEYINHIEKSLPWIHSNYLIKITEQLNKIILNWILTKNRTNIHIS